MDRKLKILVLEDVQTDFELMELQLEKENIAFISKRVETKADFKKELKDFAPDIILSDYSLPQFDGLSALKMAKEQTPDIPFIIVTGSLSEETAVTTMKAGAWDYVMKDKLIRLGPAVGEALKLKDEIEKRKLAEKMLRESEEIFRAVFYTAQDSIFFKDTSLRYKKVNTAMEELFGAGSEKLINKTDIDLFGEEAGKKVMESDKQVLKGEIIEEFPTKPVDGVMHSFHTIKVPLKDPEGKITGICGIARDITERKQAEEKLLKSEQQLSGIIDSITDHMSMIDEHNNIAWANNVARQLFGPDLIGKKCYAAYHRRDKVCDSCVVARTFEDGKVHEHETEVIGADGKKMIFWCTANVSARYGDGRPRLVVEISRDITERKRAEEEISKSEEKYRSLFENMLNGFAYCKILVDEDNQTIDFVHLEVNNAWERLIGLKREDVVGKKVTEAIPGIKESETDLISIYGKVALTGEEVKFDLYFEPLERWFTISVYSPQKGYFVAVFEDITERKRAEETLWESEEKYRTLTENVNVGVYRNTVGPKGKFIEANPAIVKMFGYRSKKEFLARNVADLYQNSEDRGKFNEKMLKDGFVENEELYLNKKDGNPIICSVSAVVVKDEKGKVIYYDGVIEDITERKQMEEMLKESHDFIEKVADSLPDVVYIYDLLRGENVYASKSLNNVLGYTPEEFKVMGNTVLGRLFHPDDLEPFMEYLEKLKKVKGNKVYEYKYRMKHKDGHWVWIQNRDMIFTRDSKGNPLQTIGTAADITKRKKAEAEATKYRKELQRLSAQLINAQEMERKRISRELHDELGQALTAIAINLSTIKNALPPDFVADIKERFKETSSLIDQVSEQMHDLALELRPSMLDDLGLVPTLRWYVNRFSKRLNIDTEFKAINLKKRLTPEIETALYRIMQEALTNTARHAQAQNVHVLINRKKSVIEASIEDDGKGFNIKGKIKGRKAHIYGAGLLGIRERITSLGGNFSIQSHPGEGTRLFIEIPLGSE